eukprot:CAMPEP_0196592684 /NCGR_PEP_ID=MMETSP1081-20130531/73487_1 /TAXON_ID=36882 /ORGANISM="Pyramimonas amylifera, Strain CCMP720" /LENGTH=205 /DNA_ID=CAMNT_0041916445 /DNA_START=160 /DNA_END=777 /DNA_ORIENTATION=-
MDFTSSRLFAKERGIKARSVPFSPAQRLHPRTKSRGSIRIRAEQESQDEGSAESLFQQELKKRGLTRGGASLDQDLDGTTKEARKAKVDEMLSRASSSGASSAFTDDQLAKSRLLNAEGIEGLPTRAGELLKLGSSFFLGFGPLVLLTIAAVVATYVAFGDDFIHQGSAIGPPPYVDPDFLLNEPTVDRMVPLQAPKPIGDYNNY